MDVATKMRRFYVTPVILDFFSGEGEPVADEGKKAVPIEPEEVENSRYSEFDAKNPLIHGGVLDEDAPEGIDPATLFDDEE